jgi:hypothetical protein
MTTNETRTHLNHLKAFLGHVENKALRLMDLVYKLEEKICDIELNESRK